MDKVTDQQKKTIPETFGKAASNYHQEADLQKKVAEGLMAALIPWKQILPLGPILEIGCGTGFLSKMLAEEFPNRDIQVTDISPEMVEFTRNELQENHPNLQFDVLDGEKDEIEEEKYSLIISNFAAQWFKDPSITFSKWVASLKQHGLLLVSFPGNKCFPEWYQACLETGLPFTANPLPDTEEVVVKLSMEPVQVDYYENSLHQKFPNSLDFFKHIKSIGASSSTTGKALNSKQFRLLNKHWSSKQEGELNVEWHIVYLATKKD